jgi:HEAT repeat protein
VVLAFLAREPAARAAEPPPTPEELLKSGDPEKREAGLAALVALGKDAARERLAIRALADPDWGVAIRAAKALEVLAGEAGRDALADVAAHGEIAWLRRAAVDALATLGPEGAVSRLFHTARMQKDATVIVRALEALARLAGADTFKKLRPFTKEQDPVIEAAGIAAVAGLTRDPAMVGTVTDLLEETLAKRGDRKRFFAYAAAVEGLAAIDTARARALIASEVVAQSDDDGHVPARVARALAKADPKAAAEAVLGVLPAAKDPAALRRWARLAARAKVATARPALEGLLADRDERVRSEATKALADLGDPAAVAAIAPLLDDRSAWVRIEAWTALGRLEPVAAFVARAPKARAEASEDARVQFAVAAADRGDPVAIPALAEMFADKSWRVASAAVATVGTLGIADDLPRLEPLLSHRAWQVRGAAFEAIGRLRAAKGIPALIQGLADKDPVVRGVCHANLQILSRQKYSAQAERWQRWWAQNGSELTLVKRSRRSAEEKAKDEAVVERYAHEAEYRRRGVEILQKARILVVTGAWDHAEKVLDHLRIPNTVLRAQELKAAGLNPNQIVLVNCEGNVDSDSAERLRWFVNVGGYLMATDWAVTKAVHVCFPGYVKQYSGSSTGNDVVVVEEAMPGHPFTAGIFDGVPALQWWLEIQAFPLTVSWPERVEVLVDSRQMRQRYGSSPMAVAFRYGLGKVQHSVSHFYLQEEALTKATKPRDRMVWAADHLGLSIPEIRRLATAGRFEGQLNEATMKEIAPDYSMFRLIVNVVREKSLWVEGL